LRPGRRRRGRGAQPTSASRATGEPVGAASLVLEDDRHAGRRGATGRGPALTPRTWQLPRRGPANPDRHHRPVRGARATAEGAARGRTCELHRRDRPDPWVLGDRAHRRRPLTITPLRAASTRTVPISESGSLSRRWSGSPRQSVKYSRSPGPNPRIASSNRRK
jgi:hypothetical protein